MSVSSQHAAREPHRRLNSRQNGHGPGRPQSLIRPQRKAVDGQEAYLYALRVAYLAYLLQPRAKRTRVLHPTQRTATSSSSNFDYIEELSTRRGETKSAKYPHDFVKALEKRLQAIMIGEDKRPEYQDSQVKRVFAIFLNHYSEPTYRKQAEESKRAEDLILMFYSKAVAELSRGKSPQDDEVKRMVDRYLALFVRLLSSLLKEKGWADERRELSTRLYNLEKKLLKHEENLASDSAIPNTIEEEVPLSYEVKDMPLVLAVGHVFGMRNTMLQSDIDKHKPEWTEAAALKDLKTYQAYLTVGASKTLSERDFDTHEAYEEWKKHEAPDVASMMVSILQVNPALAKSSAAANLPHFNAHRSSVLVDEQYAEISKALSPGSSSYTLDLPDFSSLQLSESSPAEESQEPVYTFGPNDPRAIFRFVLKLAMTTDIQDGSATSDPSGVTELLSKQSMLLLKELAFRWRIPRFSCTVLFLDCVRELYMEQVLNLDLLDAAFNYAKAPVADDHKNKRLSLITASILQERHKWTVADFTVMRQILTNLYDSLLRDLYGAMMTCFDAKQSPLLGAILAVMEEHIKSDPDFSHSNSDLEHFKQQVSSGLQQRAQEVYSEFVEKAIPEVQSAWEFYHIMQLGKKVLETAQKIQKRYRKNPEILGITPLTILLTCMLPAFAEDSKAMIQVVLDQAKAQDQEISIEDGFELYKELSDFRRAYTDALPGTQFPYRLEDIMQEFVWRWIQTTDTKVIGWVEEAVKQDDFETRNEDKTIPPTEDERQSNSVLDIFRSFTQIVDQIARLDWDDDISYAKFMTALAKLLGKGVSRYCEILDHRFRDEMDRLTPEQELAATLTTQQKYLKYAKDAWNNDNKVEPFQFYPESFVKLNNISFAIHQWDRLESDMNVDACADVIKRNEPPLTQRQRTTNYVFTIKLVEAEGLKALDVNGFSDPYVVLTDEYQKRLFKTKTIYRNLNPRWDESVDIGTRGPLNLIATVWDWDSMKDHDLVGRTSLKLDPSHFGDFLPREYWLNLDIQGRILVRVSMEGERDDIQFYFGKAFRTLQRTQRDMTRTITDKLSAYINSCLSQRTLRQLTNRNISVAKVSSMISQYRNRNSQVPAAPTGPTEQEISGALTPLFAYFNDNFSIMNRTLTSDAMLAVMTRLWKEVLMTIESLLVPPLSDLPSQQKALPQAELDIVFKWLQSLFEFFNAVNEETGQAEGIPTNLLKSPKYHEIQSLNFFYTETTENLIRTSERMASATAQSQSAQRSRLSAPAHLGAPASGGLLAPGAAPGARRAKSIMLARNLGTMRKAKEEKWKAAQAEPSDDMILRILRMRPEAAGYLRDRSRQKVRLAAVAAAEQIVRQSIMSSGGRMTGPSVIRR